MANNNNDNVIYVSGSEEARQNNEQRINEMHQRRIWIVLVLLIVLVVTAVCVFVFIKMRSFGGVKVLSTVETNYDANANYIEFGDNVLKYTPDGVSYINSKGEVVWTAGEDFKVPIASACGDYAVVADKGGNLVAVYGIEGAVSSVKMPYTVCDVGVAKQGAFAAILESDDTNYIQMYDKNGGIIYEIRTSIDKSGYPMDIAVSNDGQKLFTSYFKMDGVNIKNNLTAYNFGDVGQNENADRMVGGYSFDEEMIPKVEFVTNDVVAAFSDSKIHLYNMKEKPSEKAEVEYNSEISSVFYCEEYIGIIEPDASSGSNTGYVVKTYDLSGKKMYEYAFNMDYDKIHATNDELIITGGNQCLIILKSGRTKFNYAFDGIIKSMIPTSNRNEYIITYENRIDTVRLRGEDEN